MKRIGANLLALLAAIVAPLLIWVGLFVAIRQPLVRAAKRIGSLALVFLAAVSTPVLIWIGLFAAIYEWRQEWQIRRAPARTVGELINSAGVSVQRAPYDKTPAEAIFVPRPMPELHGLLVRAGL